MGLDQYAYVSARAGQESDYWQRFDHKKEESTVPRPREIAYWRKHPNLQGWMEQLWNEKGRPGGGSTSFSSMSTPQPRTPGRGFDFNGVELELTWEDIDRLEQAVRDSALPSTQGFFFGNPSDDHYREQDLEFCRLARAELFLGLKVFYNSSW